MRTFTGILAFLFAALVVPAIASDTAAKPSASPSPTPTPSPFAQLSFRSIGPATSGGRLSSIVGSDRDPALYYAGSAGGGVWKSTNGGYEWHPVFDDQPVASIGAIAIDPRAVETVWVGTGEANPRNDISPGNGIYKTTDAGRTWVHLGLDGTSQISAISIDPRNSNTVVVAALGDPFADSADRGIFRTTDGGATWSKVLYLGASTGASDVVRSPANPNVLFAGMWQLRRTGWSLASGGPQDGLYRSDDAGATWQQVTGHGLPTDTLGRISVAIAPSSSKRVYALIQSRQGILWRSDDGGANWQLTSSDTNIDERPFYFNRVFVDPANADKVYSSSVHLVVSTDGGKTFSITARRTHGDHHAMWISADGKRIAEGNDGGVALSNDSGATWDWRNVIPIAQLYHVGFDHANPYRVCAPLQDNGVWCAPNNSRSPGGITGDQWEFMGGGDGAWALPDPSDEQTFWMTSGGGNNGGELDIFNDRTKQTYAASVDLRDQNVVPPAQLRYRFNWETPIAFDPFDTHHAYSAANVLFDSRDRGHSWHALSPDLTRNTRSHEQMTGGVTLDGTGAETSDTILYIEPSSAARGEIWVGTDDGLIQITKDGGKHWRNVTPPIPKPYGRFASLSASHTRAGTAYAVYDAHMTGDRSPYLYRTDDYGAHWTALTTGLPADHFVRSVRIDPRNESVVYLGTEYGLYLSFDRGAHWQDFRQNVPVASVRDVQIQPNFNDIVIGTHGRSVWILDDASPLQQLSRAKAAGSYVFAPRPAYLYEVHSGGNIHDFSGDNPPYGALVTYYLQAPAKTNPTAQILDARGKVVRRFDTHDENGKNVPDLSNQAGYNRFSWDLTEDKPAGWDWSGAWNQFASGAVVVPGQYTVVISVDGKRLRAPIHVEREPRDTATLAMHAARYALEHRLYAQWSRINTALNSLSRVAYEAEVRKKSLASAGNDALIAQLDVLKAHALDLQSSMTSNPKADQDDDFLMDLLRERLQSLIFTFDAFDAPSAAAMAESATLQGLADNRVAAVDRFLRVEVAPVDAQLQAAHLTSLLAASAPPIRPAGSADSGTR